MKGAGCESPISSLSIDPFIVDENLDDITTTEKRDRRSRRESVNEMVELSDEDGTISYDILNDDFDRTSSLNGSENSRNITPGAEDLIDDSEKNEDDKSTFIDVDP